MKYAIPIVLILGLSIFGQNSVTEEIRDYRKANEKQILREFFDLLSIPNVASDTKNIYRNANYLVEELKGRNLNPKLLKASDPKVPPVVFGEWMVPGATKTIVFYAHYDGQPTDARQWTNSHPWKPILRTDTIKNGGKTVDLNDKLPINPDWRIYARSASDDKGGVFTILKAIDAMRAKRITPKVNIKLFFEGEEEAGSANLREILTKHKKLLRSDGWIICDGPAHQSGRKQVVFGVRGVTSVSLTVYGANRPLHSGHYGNWSPNPGFRLVQLLSTMKDDSGRVLVKDWYDDVEPLTSSEKNAIANAPQYDEQLKRDLGLSATEGGSQSLLELINLPSLNINGMKTGNVGKLARNIIPSEASAVLGLRLVKGNDHKRQIEKLRKHVVNKGFYVIDRDPTDKERLKYPLIAKFVGEDGGYNAQRTNMDLPISRAVKAAVQRASDGEIVALPTLGGSLPLSIITETLDDVPTITVPIANFDNNQHAVNENLKIQNLWEGIEIFASLMTMQF